MEHARVFQRVEDKSPSVDLPEQKPAALAVSGSQFLSVLSRVVAHTPRDTPVLSTPAFVALPLRQLPSTPHVHNTKRCFARHKSSKKMQWVIISSDRLGVAQKRTPPDNNERDSHMLAKTTKQSKATTAKILGGNRV